MNKSSLKNKPCIFLHLMHKEGIDVPRGETDSEKRFETLAIRLGYCKKNILHLALTEGALFRRHPVCRDTAYQMLEIARANSDKVHLYTDHFELLEKAVAMSPIHADLKSRFIVRSFDHLQSEAAKDEDYTKRNEGELSLPRQVQISLEKVIRTIVQSIKK